MAMDPRQILGAFLTLTMFTMLGNMIKKDHFDSNEVKLPEFKAVQIDAIAVSEQSLVSLPRLSKGPWKEDEPQPKPCWTKQWPKMEQSNGFVIFTLTNGPEYHVSQVANAVVVARYLGATLVLPFIKGTKLGETRHFREIYDMEKFIKSLKGVVKIEKTQPAELSKGKVAVTRLPNRIAEDHIVKHIEPVFRREGNIRLETYFPSINMKKTEEKGSLDSITCLALYGTLELQPEVNEAVDSLIEKLRTLGRKSDGQFIAVDLRFEKLEKKGCQGNVGTGRKSCYSPQEVAIFLRNIGFDRDTTIYVTQSRWHGGLDPLKNFFPNTYTKERLLQKDEAKKYLSVEGSEFEKVLDFSICSQSDVFVPAISGLFYANVAGKRIATGRSQILVPGKVTSSSSVTDFISPYVSKKNHMAYSCFC